MDFLTKLQATMVQWGQISASSLAILAGAGVVYLCLRRAVNTLEKHHYLPGPLVATMRRIVFWVVLVASVLLVLQTMGVLRSVLAAVTGVLALVSIGFVAVWSVLSNTLCSLILMVTRPFRIGDTLSFPPDDLRGRVVNFNMLFTTLETEDGLLLQVPNNTFFQRPIVRKKGRWHIRLGDQLYEADNATADSVKTQAPDSSISRAA